MMSSQSKGSYNQGKGIVGKGITPTRTRPAGPRRRPGTPGPSTGSVCCRSTPGLCTAARRHRGLAFGRAHVRGLVPVLPQRDIVGAEVTRVAIAGRVLPRAAVGVAAREADPQMAVFRRRGIRHALEVVRVLVAACVEINQCVGCTRQFFTKSFLGDDAADLARSSGEEPASPRHRAGVASMAWRTTR